MAYTDFCNTVAFSIRQKEENLMDIAILFIPLNCKEVKIKDVFKMILHLKYLSI